MLMLTPGRIRNTVAEHAAVVGAIAAGDIESARVAMDRHLTETTGQFESFARERPELISA